MSQMKMDNQRSLLHTKPFTILHVKKRYIRHIVSNLHTRIVTRFSVSRCVPSDNGCSCFFFMNSSL